MPQNHVDYEYGSYLSVLLGCCLLCVVYVVEMFKFINYT